MKIINRWTFLLQAFSFFLGYMQWGKGNSAFVYEAAKELFTKQSGTLQSFTHPLIFTALAGLCILLWTAAGGKTHRYLLLAGILLPGCLIAFILLAGLLSLNGKMLLSVLPYTLLALYHLRRIFPFRNQSAA